MLSVVSQLLWSTRRFDKQKLREIACIRIGERNKWITVVRIASKLANYAAL